MDAMLKDLEKSPTEAPFPQSLKSNLRDSALQTKNHLDYLVTIPTGKEFDPAQMSRMASSFLEFMTHMREAAKYDTTPETELLIRRTLKPFEELCEGIMGKRRIVL